MKSQMFTLNSTDMGKISRGALVAVAGALITYAAEIIPGVDFGDYTPIAVAIAGILVNAARKWIAGYDY